MKKSWSDDNWVRSDADNKEANVGIPTDVAYRLANADNTDSTIQLNCYLLDQTEIENNPDLIGEYNVARAIATFNKKVEPLLIVFNKELRESLLISNPEERGFFTKTQCELVSGIPNNESDQDTIEDLLTITDLELKFWNRVGISPNYIYDLAEEGWEEHIDLVK